MMNTRAMGRRFPAVLLLACCAAMAPYAAAAPAAWQDTMYSYRGEQTALGQRLEAFATTLGVKLRLHDARLARSTVPADAVASNAVAYMDRLAATQRFQWFVYNGALYVSAAGAAVTERVSLQGMNAAGARQALVGLGLFEEKFGWGEADDSAAAVFVSGPPDYLALVKEVLAKQDAKSDTPETMLFRLKYAMAADHESSARDRVVQQHGVASILRDLLAKRPGGRSEAFLGPGPMAMAKEAGGSAPAGTEAGPPGRFAPTVEAYAPLNAVLVRDLPARRAMYDDLIKALDVAVDQVEIQVTIVDAKSGTLRDWSAGISRNTLFGGARMERLGADEGKGDANLVFWSLGKLSLELRALESEGRLHVVSRPSLVTFDNVGAMLDMSQSAYVKLLGERTTDLKGLTAGTMLKVIPRVIKDADDPSIQMLVEIEDGKITAAGDGEASARAQRNTVSTQAVVRPGQALVIGGYNRDEDSSGSNRVPLLGKIPLLGRLFSADSSSSEKTERLFILSARVVARDGSAAAPAGAPALPQPADQGESSHAATTDHQPAA